MEKTDNEIIAEFMGGVDAEDIGNPYEYHKYWDCLMPVVQRIEKTKTDEYSSFDVFILNDTCTIAGCKRGQIPVTISKTNAETKIKAVYSSGLEWIKWYTSNQPKKQ